MKTDDIKAELDELRESFRKQIEETRKLIPQHDRVRDEFKVIPGYNERDGGKEYSRFIIVHSESQRHIEGSLSLQLGRIGPDYFKYESDSISQKRVAEAEANRVCSLYNSAYKMLFALDIYSRLASVEVKLKGIARAITV